MDVIEIPSMMWMEANNRYIYDTIQCIASIQGEVREWYDWLDLFPIGFFCFDFGFIIRFLADRNNGHAYATVLRPSVWRL